MKFHTAEYVLWATGIVLYGSLFFTLCRRQLGRRSPVFGAWILEMFVTGIVMFIVSRLATTPHVYTVAFWCFTALELLLQIGVSGEFAVLSLRQGGVWVRGSTLPLFVGGVSSFVVAAGLTSCARPAILDAMDREFSRIHLFSSLLTVFLTCIVFATSVWLSSLWTGLDLKRLMGFVLFASVSAFTDSLHLYWRTQANFSSLEIFRMASSQIILVYWLVILRRDHDLPPPATLEDIRRFGSLYKADTE